MRAVGRLSPAVVLIALVGPDPTGFLVRGSVGLLVCCNEGMSRGLRAGLAGRSIWSGLEGARVILRRSNWGRVVNNRSCLRVAPGVVCV